MDLRRRLHTAVAALVAPALVLSAPVGAGVAIVWALLGVARRPSPAAPAMAVAAGVACVVSVVHAGSLASALVVVAAAVAIAWLWWRVGAVCDGPSAAALGLGAAVTALGLASASLAEALASGFAQTHVATTHPNVTGALALALGAASALAARLGGAVGWSLAASGMAASLVTVLLTGSRGSGLGAVLGALALGVVLLLRWLARRRPRTATALVLAAPLALLVAFQAIAFSPARVDAWWPRTVEVVAGTVGVDASTPFGRRVLALREPLGTTGGRLVNWRVGRELVAVRPFLGFGFDVVPAVYRDAVRFRTSSPLTHPHHGPLTLALQGGALLLVAVAAVVFATGWRLAAEVARGDAASALLVAFGAAVLAVDLLDAMSIHGQVVGLLSVAALAALASARDRSRER